MIEQTVILWGFGLLLAGLFLAVLELFVPSGGVIGIVAFRQVSWMWGTISLLLVLVLTPVTVNFALRVMPNTPMGRQLILVNTEEEQAERALREQERLQQEQALVGARGVALTDLRPIGSAEIEGTRLEVMADGGPIESGSAVKVWSVHGNQVRVRAVS